MERCAHTAVCLGPGDHPQVLVYGGLDRSGKVLSDMWVVDVHSGRWREVSMCNLQFGPPSLDLGNIIVCIP